VADRWRANSEIVPQRRPGLDTMSLPHRIVVPVIAGMGGGQCRSPNIASRATGSVTGTKASSPAMLTTGKTGGQMGHPLKVVKTERIIVEQMINRTRYVKPGIGGEPHEAPVLVPDQLIRHVQPTMAGERQMQARATTACAGRLDFTIAMVRRHKSATGS
jgi:hypothetical protein